MRYIVILIIVSIICIVYLKTNSDMIEKLIKLPLLNIVEVVREKYGEENVSLDINKLLLSISLVISLTLTTLYLLLINVKKDVVQQGGNNLLMDELKCKSDDLLECSSDDLKELKYNTKKFFIL